MEPITLFMIKAGNIKIDDNKTVQQIREQFNYCPNSITIDY